MISRTLILALFTGLAGITGLGAQPPTGPATPEPTSLPAVSTMAALPHPPMKKLPPLTQWGIGGPPVSTTEMPPGYPAPPPRPPGFSTAPSPPPGAIMPVNPVEE